MKIDAIRVLARRRMERERLIGPARELTARLDPGLGCRAVVVFGSVARGEFNLWSDVDVLLVADNVPPGWSQRISALGRFAPEWRPWCGLQGSSARSWGATTRSRRRKSIGVCGWWEGPPS